MFQQLVSFTLVIKGLAMDPGGRMEYEITEQGPEIQQQPEFLPVGMPAELQPNRHVDEAAEESDSDEEVAELHGFCDEYEDVEADGVEYSEVPHECLDEDEHENPEEEDLETGPLPTEMEQVWTDAILENDQVFDSLNDDEVDIRWQPNGLKGKRKNSGSGWANLTFHDIHNELLPPRIGVRLTRHFPRLGAVRWQIWYPPVVAGAAESHSITTSKAKTTQALDCCLDWAWDRHATWEQQMANPS